MTNFNAIELLKEDRQILKLEFSALADRYDDEIPILIGSVLVADL